MWRLRIAAVKKLDRPHGQSARPGRGAGRRPPAEPLGLPLVAGGRRPALGIWWGRGAGPFPNRVQLYKMYLGSLSNFGAVSTGTWTLVKDNARVALVGAVPTVAKTSFGPMFPLHA